MTPPSTTCPHCQHSPQTASIPPLMSMSLRDLFAGMALQGLVAHAEYNSKAQTVAGIAYMLADAMLKQREQS